MASVGGDEESISLNIMPMLDIFSILILFLLMNFSTDPISHDLSEGLELPESATIASLDEIPAIIITPKHLVVNEKKIADIVDGEIARSAVTQGGIKPLYDELKKLSEGNRLLQKEKQKNIALTVEVDKRHKFRLLKKVLLSAQQADFITFKLTVSKEIM